ncbi:unnamed protein product, partial [marine sediment metagenome]
MTATHYRIQVNSKADFSGDEMWDSEKKVLDAPVDETERSENIDYLGKVLSSLTKYYWRIKFYSSETEWSSETAYFITPDKEAPWKEDVLEPTGEAKVEIPRRSGEWTALEDVMRIHTSNGKDTSSPRAPIEIGQAELLCCNISKNFNSFEAASVWYKNLEGYATQISLGCNIGGSPVSTRLFTGIIKTVHPHRLSQTAEIKVID